MRIGVNPLKHRALLPPYKRHRVIMAVYIPEQKGYFEHALEIFRLSLASLLATVDLSNVSITVIDNASIPEVAELLSITAAAGQIDRHIRHSVNRGKPDAVIAEIKATYERLVTVVDSDVLFLPGWLGSVESIYQTWPTAGAVSPASQPKLAFYQNASTWIHAVLRMAVQLRKYVSDKDMQAFAHSVGNEALYRDYEVAAQYAVRNGTQAALIGAGHFVMTVRRECFKNFEYVPRLEGTGRGMRELDAQIDKCGGLRLSTTKAYVLHMGNTLEPWMHQRLMQIPIAIQPLAPPGNMQLDSPWRARTLVPFALRRWLAKPIMRAAQILQRLRATKASTNAAT